MENNYIFFSENELVQVKGIGHTQFDGYGDFRHCIPRATRSSGRNGHHSNSTSSHQIYHLTSIAHIWLSFNELLSPLPYWNPPTHSSVASPPSRKMTHVAIVTWTLLRKYWCETAKQGRKQSVLTDSASSGNEFVRVVLEHRQEIYKFTKAEPGLARSAIATFDFSMLSGPETDCSSTLMTFHSAGWAKHLVHRTFVKLQTRTIRWNGEELINLGCFSQDHAKLGESTE